MTRDAELRAVIGYLNFSDGAFSPKFHRAIDDYFAKAQQDGLVEIWPALVADLGALLKQWKEQGSPFGDVSQAETIIALAADVVAPGYRRFHADLLQHLDDEELFQPFFVGRLFERTLQASAASENAPTPPSIDAAAAHEFGNGVAHSLNEFVGYRPMVVLEGRRPLEAYPHERVAPVPIYLRSVGVASGGFFALATQALELLRNAPADLLQDAGLDLDVLEEIAIDPRAYDHQHPVNQRPGCQFGEWDPHRINAEGRYTRFVTRRVILKTLQRWLATETASKIDVEQRVKESAAVLAGTILLASGVTGGGPGDLTSDHTPAVIVAHVSRLRDRFYTDLVSRWPGPHGERLRKEAVRDRQPFGRLRQHLNLELGRLRAQQLQRDGVARQYARLGRSEAAAAEAAKVESPSCRLKCQIESTFVRGERAIRSGAAAEAADAAKEIADLLKRAIECGATADPWGVLAFQGHYPLFHHIPESANDSRVEELLGFVDRLFRLYARAWAAAAVGGDEKTSLRCDLESSALADWWHPFASHEVSGLRRVHARELHESAQFVARVSKAWRQTGAAPGDVPFWRRSADDFSAVQSYALILEALLQAGDVVAAQSLLIHWLSSGRAFEDENAGAEFDKFARLWLEAALARPADERRTLVRRFFELLEANADESWYAPGPELVGSDDSATPVEESPLSEPEDEPGEEDVFSAAYENVTYKDTTADGNEGSMLEAGPPNKDLDDLAQLQRVLNRRLQFLLLVAKLFQRAASVEGRKLPAESAASWSGWALHMDANRRKLQALIQALESAAGEPSSLRPDALTEFGRRQAYRDELLDDAIACMMETSHAFHWLAAASGVAIPADVPKWEARLVRTRAAMLRNNRERIRRSLSDLFQAFKPLVVLYLPLHLGGKALKVAKARLAREAMKRLAEELPRAGLPIDAFRLLEVARQAERNGLRDVRMVTEFESVFTAGFRATMAVLSGLLARWTETKGRDAAAADVVRDVVQRFARLWGEHVSGVRISEIERRTSERAWERTRKFIKRYGGELFNQAFLQYGNLRGILAQGVGEYLKSLLEEGGDELAPKLMNDLGGGLSFDEAVEEIGFVLQVVYSHYDLFRDYNTTTTQSDYGENVFVLLDLVKVSVAYDRDWWAMRPIYLAHRELAAAGRLGVADLLRTAFVAQMARNADARRKELVDVERKNGVVLASVRDKIDERYAKPFELDRALARLRDAVGDAAPNDAAFGRLREALEPFTASPTGSGFEPPDWLRKFESEVDRLLGESIDAALQSRALPRLSYDEFRKQLEAWEEAESND